MKTLSIALLCSVVFFTACQKDYNKIEALNAASNLPNKPANTDALQYNAAVGTYTLTLQPSAKDGDDLWMKLWLGHPAYADTCDGTVGLIKGLAYSLQGTLVTTRSIIKFDSLFKVPATAKLLSATLYLYGPSPTSKDVKKHLPMGNTSYPGSDKGDNTCMLQRITSAWNASSICWNNPPLTTTADQNILNASTKQWQYDVAIDVTNMVKPMVANAADNNGFLLRLKTETKPRAMGFLSANANEVARRPKLVVTYQ